MRIVQTSVIVILALGAFATYGARAWYHSQSPDPAQIERISEQIASFPTETTNPRFFGKPYDIEPRIVTLSGAEEHVAMIYAGEGGGHVRLFLGTASRSLAWFHEPSVCLPVQGWQTTSAAQVPIWSDLPGTQPDDRVWRMTTKKIGGEMIVYHWLQWGSRVVTTKRQRDMLRLRSLFAGERDQPMQIAILYAPVHGGVEKTEARVASLVRALWPSLSTVVAPGDR